LEPCVVATAGGAGAVAAGPVDTPFPFDVITTTPVPPPVEDFTTVTCAPDGTITVWSPLAAVFGTACMTTHGNANPAAATPAVTTLRERLLIRFLRGVCAAGS
jgi:hypothetical protein